MNQDQSPNTGDEYTLDTNKSYESWTSLNTFQKKLENFQEAVLNTTNAQANDSMEVPLDKKGDLSSLHVIFSMSNAIIGPNLILLPLLFLKTGILTSALAGIIFGYIGYKTCYLTVMHVKPNEPEYLFAIKRVLGQRWMALYFWTIVTALWVVCIIFYLALIPTLYSGISDLVVFSGKAALPPADVETLNQFSITWLSIIVAAFIFIAFCFKDISIIVNLSSKGGIGILAAFVFLIYIGFKAIIEDQVKLSMLPQNEISAIPLFSLDGIFTLVGFYGAAYTIHFLAVPVLRTSREPTKKYRNVLISYTFTWLLYLFTGVFGALGICWRLNKTNSQSTIFGLYSDDEKDVFIMSLVAQCAVAFQLITVIPVLNHIARNQVFSFIWGKHEVTYPKWAYYVWNILMISSLVTCKTLDFSPTVVMNVVGTFNGFVITYLVPILLHIKSNQIYRGKTEGLNIYKLLAPNIERGSVVDCVHEKESEMGLVRFRLFYWGLLCIGLLVLTINSYIKIKEFF